jgi:MoaA/NifB/PqqE/SkfB family radical SAM enzyme
MKISQIVIELLTKCNFACPYCRDTSGEKKAILLDEAKEIISNFKELGIKKVQLDGGETMLYKDISELIDYIVDKGLELGIYTNGSVITSEVAEALAKYSNIKLCITIHPLNPEKQIQATIDGIKNLSEVGIYPQIIYVVNSFSYIKLSETLKRLPKGNYHLVLNPIVQSGRAFDNGIKPLNDKQKKEFLDILTQIKEEYKYLEITDNVSVKSENLMIEKIQMNSDEEFALHINTDGYVLPFFSADSSTAVGNIHDMDDLKRKLTLPETLEYFENSKIAMKRRIEGTQNSKQRKISREEIV